MRRLTTIEENRLKVLTNNSVSFTLIEPTAVGLSKSIMDATVPVRNYLKSCKCHDYGTQLQGPENKVLFNTLVYAEDSVSSIKASMYRPKTKLGDPRIWFYNFKKNAAPNDIIVIIYFDNLLHVFNLTCLPIEKLVYSSKVNPVKELVDRISSSEKAVANELLDKLREINRLGPIRSTVDADTAVGRTLESQLGIQMNSSQEPDYKGIELKSSRARRVDRKNLFALVPDWKLSKFKSSSQILEEFGYRRGADFKLYCTVSTLKPNSQGLMLRIDNDIRQLVENSDKDYVGDFAVWTLDKLHKKLLSKHKETFWISANSMRVDGNEYFEYTEVKHTKSPIVSQFDFLLEQGIITLDHAICKKTDKPAKEKGPIFKIKENSLDLLFPHSETYFLNA